MGYFSFSKAQFWLKMYFSFLATFELCFGLCYLLSLRGKSRLHSEPHYQQWCILMCTDNTYPHLHVFSFPASCFPNSPHTRILTIFHYTKHYRGSAITQRRNNFSYPVNDIGKSEQLCRFSISVTGRCLKYRTCYSSTIYWCRSTLTYLLGSTKKN